VLTDAVHLALASLWAGSLLALAATLLRARRLPLAYEEELLPLVTRFAALATVAIVTLAFTGLVRTLGELPSAGALLDTDYGRWLLAKLALVAAALVLALASRRALARFASGAGTSATLGALRRALPAEAALALLVLGAVAVLGQLPNPRGAEVNVASVTIPFNSIVPANDLAVHLQVTPARAGPNELRVHAYHPDGSDPGEFGSVRVTVSNITLGEGGTTFEAEPQGSGIFTTTATISNLSPTWTVTADVRRVGEDDARAEFRVPIEAPLAADDPGPFASPAPQLSANALGAVLFAAGGAGALLLTWRSRRRLAPHARTAALGALAASGILWLSADTHGTGTPALQNPFAGDVDSVQRGAALYTTSCVGCHGAQGLGDGPDAVGLSLAPADLSLHVPLHPETDTYAFIAQGFPGTAMPGWATELSEDQIWDLVNYLRDEFDAGVLGATSAR
jgi:mono/diheme cytochrome c family protein